MKILPALLALSFLPCSVVFAEIYKYRGQDGSIVFSDQKNPNGQQEVIEMAPPNVMPLNSSRQSASSSSHAVSNSQNQKPQDLYSSIRIVSPTLNEAVRANSGSVSVKIDAMPPLDVGAGDLVRVILDGTPAAQGASTVVVLDGLDRGEHQVRAEIVDIDGQVLKSSDAVTFQVLRYSALFNKK